MRLQNRLAKLGRRKCLLMGVEALCILVKLPCPAGHCRNGNCHAWQVIVEMETAARSLLSVVM